MVPGVRLPTPVDQALRPRARVSVTLLSLMGAVALGMAVTAWESASLLRFAGFLAVAALSGGIVINAPGVISSLSLTFLFVLFGVAELTGPETVVLASVATLVQCFSNQSRRPGLQQIAFNVAIIALAATRAVWIYRAYWIVLYEKQPAVRLAFATMTLFLLSTAPVAVAVALAQEGSVLPVGRGAGVLW